MQEPEPVKLFPTGATLLDLQNGGGWAMGRMVNIVGDTSTGKTLLVIEACANFARLYGAQHVRYVETEAAFDELFAARMGLPGGIQRCGDLGRGGPPTVEHFNDDLSDFLKGLNGSPGLYCLDSADALSCQAELERKIMDKGTYHTEKAKVFHEVFRRQVADIGRHKCCLMIVSQTKDNIGVFFGPDKTRSGGHALDFFASQIIWLAERGKEKRTVLGGVERIVGVNVRSANKKNKVGEPFHTIDFLLMFNYGVDDELSMIHWLIKNRARESGLTHPLDKYEAEIKKVRQKRDTETLAKYASELRAATRERWLEIEDALRPPLSKYGVVS
jgi:recombination protein RecA